MLPTWSQHSASHRPESWRPRGLPVTQKEKPSSSPPSQPLPSGLKKLAPCLPLGGSREETTVLKFTSWGQTLAESMKDVLKDRSQEKKGTTEDEMVGWHHQLYGHEFEQALGDAEGQEAWRVAVHGVTKSKDMTERLNKIKWRICICWVKV